MYLFIDFQIIKKSSIILLMSIIFINFSALAQPVNGIFTNLGQENENEKRVNEILFVKGDSVFWFTGNRNGIYTTSGYYGISCFQTNRRNFKIIPENNNLGRYIISIDRTKSDHNSVRLFFEGKQGNPMIFVSVFISKQHESDRMIFVRTNNNGALNLSDSTIIDLKKKDKKMKFKQKKKASYFKREI